MLVAQLHYNTSALDLQVRPLMEREPLPALSAPGHNHGEKVITLAQNSGKL